MRAQPLRAVHQIKCLGHLRKHCVDYTLRASYAKNYSHVCSFRINSLIRAAFKRIRSDMIAEQHNPICLRKLNVSKPHKTEGSASAA
jgi:hypothetical protein